MERHILNFTTKGNSMDASPRTARADPTVDASATTAKLDPAANGTQSVINPWLMQVPSSGGAEYMLLAPDTYSGTIIWVIDVGHQIDKFNKEETTAEVHQIVLVFELTERRPDGKPFLLSRSYTWSLHEKANFYKLVNAVTSRTFNENEWFDPRDLLGKPVAVQVTNSSSGSAATEKTYHRVEHVAAPPKGMPASRPENALFSYSVVVGGEFRPPFEAPHIYGQPIKDLIAASREARARTASDCPF
jgi:hypothetical protein